MSMKVNIPWLNRTSQGGGWGRKHTRPTQSAPQQSVTMQEDDLDHLGALHEVIAQKGKPKRFCKWF